MQSAFVDLGLERDGFLYVSDVVATFEEFDRLDTDDDDAPAAAQAAGDSWRTVRATARATAAGVTRPRQRRVAASATRVPNRRSRSSSRRGRRSSCRWPRSRSAPKGARLTSHATMPGRFLVFMPTVDHVGVSRKIDSREERSRLRGIVREFREQNGFTGGVIIRTAAAGRPKDDIVSDLSYFHRVWTEIGRRPTARVRRPSCIARRASCPSCCATS
jgi:ribonuclease G